MSDFKVPLGKDPEGNHVSPRDAKDGINYTCPNPLCGKPLVLCHGYALRKDGHPRATHFKHKPGRWDPAICNGETWLHNTAKGFISAVIQDWMKDGSRAPEIISGQQADRFKKLLQLFSRGLKPSRVLVEYKHSTRQPDVSLICSNEKTSVLALAIEVCVTHKVDVSKAQDYLAAGISWIEVSAEDIIAKPAIWIDISEPFLHIPQHVQPEPVLVEASQPARSSRQQAMPPVEKPGNWLTDFLKGAGLVALTALAVSAVADDFGRSTSRSKRRR